MKRFLVLSLLGNTEALSPPAEVLLAAGTLDDNPNNYQGLFENPTGPFWTAWSDTYGCGNMVTDRKFCAFPRRYLLESVQYKECVMRDDDEYPAYIFDGQLVHSRYRNFLTQKGVLSETDVAGYELLNFQDVKPVSGDPEVDRLRQGYGQMRNFFSEISLDITSDPPRFTADELLNRSKVCNIVDGIREGCKASSKNIKCDPRIEKYATDNGITQDDVAELLQADNTQVKAAIPGDFLTFKSRYQLCEDFCPVPLPFTKWTCNCRFGSNYETSEVGAESCSCGDEAPKRYQQCYDRNTADDITCSSMSLDMATEYPGQCLVQNFVVDTDPYVSKTTPAIPGYNPTLYESWYSRATEFYSGPTTNWYQLSHKWITPQELNVPWRNYKVKSLEDVKNGLSSALDNGLKDALIAIMPDVTATAGAVRVRVSTLLNTLKTKGVIVEIAGNILPIDPASSYSEQMGGVLDSTTDIYNEIQKSIFLKNPCYNVADLVLTNPVITIVNYQTNKPQYSLVPANAGADASEISIKYVTNTVNGETPQEAAVKAILVFISESFTPQEIGYQVNDCREVTGTIGQWAEWTKCLDDVCGGTRKRIRQCTTSSGEILEWLINSSVWSFLDTTLNGANSNAGCFCKEITGYEEEECGQRCQYEAWSSWSPCRLTGQDPNKIVTCKEVGESGTQQKTRGVTCGDSTFCSEQTCDRECFIPVCPGWAEWAPWSCCSVTCGDVPGHHVRTRKCQGAEIGSSYCPCGGVLAGDNTCTSLTQSCQNMYIPKAGDTGYFETKSCQVESACPLLIEEWSQWTACSVTCGTGSKTRSYKCENAEDQLGKIAECMGDGSVHEEVICKEEPCRTRRAVDTEWSNWSECACGISGQAKNRNRMSSGVSLSEISECSFKMCPRMSEWTAWSKCTEDCESRGGLERRFQNCEFGTWGVNSECGEEMPIETRSCIDMPQCPSWATWGQWFDNCNKTGYNIRSRECQGQDEIIPLERECDAEDEIEIIECSKKLKFESINL